METILDRIVKHKKQEVASAKQVKPVKQLEKKDFFSRDCISLKERLSINNLPGIIAEFKRQSPSRGVINDSAGLTETVKGYADSGASGISILTDGPFFGGSLADLADARGAISRPVLRKDFIIDEYQVVEAKSMGADVVLLIAAILSPKEIDALARFAKSLGLEVLMEVHSREELDRSLSPSLDMIGVNNRNLKTFDTDIETSHKLCSLIPDEFVKISESGLGEAQVVLALKEKGFDGFLMGESFMKHSQPELACRQFIEELGSLKGIDLKR